VAQRTELDVERLLRALVDGRVDFVVIGGVLTSLDARQRGVPEDVPFVADGATLKRVDVLTLSTVAGDLDVLRVPSGAPR
jgi:predicted nucleotidyltransferase